MSLIYIHYIALLPHVDHPDTPTGILGRVDGCDAGVVQKRGILTAVQTMSAVLTPAVSTGGSGRRQMVAETLVDIYPVPCSLHFITLECHIVCSPASPLAVVCFVHEGKRRREWDPRPEREVNLAMVESVDPVGPAPLMWWTCSPR